MQTLTRFNLDWKVTKAVMITTGAVILGSAALAILLGGEFVPQDLDIYITSQHMGTVLVFLEEQGYKVIIPTPNARKNEYPTSTVTLTLKNDAGEKIDLCATTEQHVVHTIAKFHSTCVMNYVAYYGIVCLYPAWTMRRIALLRDGPIDQQAIDKYRGRGFAMRSDSSEMPDYEANHRCDTHRYCAQTRQELHDHATLCIPLEDKEWTLQSEEKMRVGWVLQDNMTSDD